MCHCNNVVGYDQASVYTTVHVMTVMQVFLDTDSSKYGELKIETTEHSKPLGIGGYGFVCKGKLLQNEV